MMKVFKNDQIQISDKDARDLYNKMALNIPENN
jgi:hypothetical protein